MEGVDILNGVIFPYINLAIFLILAIMMFKRPIKNGLASKRVAYEELVKRAMAAKEEAEARNQELKERLVSLDKEIEEIKLKARIQAEMEAKQLIDSAEHLAEHLKREARRIAETEVASAKAELQRDIIEQVKRQTVEQLKLSLDDARQHQVVQLGLNNLSQVRAEVIS